MGKGRPPAHGPVIGANDNLAVPIPSAQVEAALLRIARLLGRQIAREALAIPQAANDNVMVSAGDDVAT